MPDSTISSLPPASPVTPTDLIPCVQAGVTKIFTAQQLLAAANAASLQVADYTALRSVTANIMSVYVTGYRASTAPSGIAGLFVRDDSDTTTADNGGTVIVASNGKRWKRAEHGCVDVRVFGAVGDSSQNFADKLTAITAAWNSALTYKHDLYFPNGDWGIGASYYPWHQAGTPSGFLDCHGITLLCEGPQTVFSTTSATGADVFQLNALKNFHVKGFPTLTAYLTGTSGSGSNGVSFTNGADNITLEVTCENLPSIDRGAFVDGGKAVTMQTGGVSFGFGKVRVSVRSKGCAEGFGIEPDLVAALTNKTAVDVDVTAEDCFYGVKCVAGSSSGALVQGMWSGINIRFTTINCQKDVVLQRAHGVKVIGHAVSTKTKAALLLNPNSVQWMASESVVESLLCNYAKNSDIQIDGFKSNCDYKARIGGASAGSSGLNGASEYCHIRLNIGGTASSSDLFEMVSGSDSLSNSVLEITASTTATIPAGFFTASKSNTIISRGSPANTQPIVSALRFPTAQVASADPNALDDYSEGSWTPAFSVGGVGTAVFTIVEAKYTKIGRMVLAQFAATRNDASALSGTVTWSLPFAAAGFTNWVSAGTSWVQTIGTGVVVINNYAANIANLVLDSTGADMTYSNLVNGKRLNVSMVYMAS